MKGKNPARIQDLIGLVHRSYPPLLAEEWDQVGLQIGDPAAPLARVLVGLDPSLENLLAAAEVGAEALLTHHPLIFRPLTRIHPSDETGRIVWEAVRRNIAVLCAHTNLDRARDGLNDWLAEAVGLERCLPLAPGKGGDLFKLVAYVPVGYEEAVATALFQAGAGQIGGYDRCSFRTEGTGTFRAGEASRPFLGQPGETERAREVRLETVVPAERLDRVLSRLRKAHPYEEPAYDLVPLANARPGVGLGRIGCLANPVRLDHLALRLKEKLGARSLRLVGDPQRMVAKVAVCGGSGGSLLGEARRQGADVLVTGDVKYHEARSAEALGPAVIDAGHFATERLAVGGLVEHLGKAAAESGLAMEFIAAEDAGDPFFPI